jgi:hypothetical protein
MPAGVLPASALRVPLTDPVEPCHRYDKSNAATTADQFPNRLRVLVPASFGEVLYRWT